MKRETVRSWEWRDYIHGNPVRKGLVRYPEDWRYSSAQTYATGDIDNDGVIVTQITW